MAPTMVLADQYTSDLVLRAVLGGAGSSYVSVRPPLVARNLQGCRIACSLRA
jgi:hypothetical protein